MAFDSRGLDPGASAAGAPNAAVYGTTADAAATVEAANYFDTVRGSLKNDFSKGSILAVMTDATILYGYSESSGVITLDVANKKTLD